VGRSRAGRAAFGLVAAAVFCGGLAGGIAASPTRTPTQPVASVAPEAMAPGPASPHDEVLIAGTWRRISDAPWAGAFEVAGRPSPSPAGSGDPAGPAGPGGPGAPGGKPNPHPRFTPGLVAHVPVLMYHRIVPWAKAGRSLPGLVVPPDTFAAQMRTLAAAGWHTVTAAQLAADLAAGRRPKPRTFVITFDDGWADGYRYALPILRRNGFVGTFYVISGRISRLSGFLSPTQLQAMQAAGMEIGDHTVSHADLPARTTSKARYEIVHAADQIAVVVGVRPSTFAYPYGARNLRDESLVARAGFALALTTVEGCLEISSNQFSVPRLRVGPGTSPTELLGTLERCWALDR
jgi:peptidoglycan/xylan/chitin deacetylase (PgdA/CDA1 family)